jgi:tellurite resistance-related uncharacterized protein
MSIKLFHVNSPRNARGRAQDSMTKYASTGTRRVAPSPIAYAGMFVYSAEASTLNPTTQMPGLVSFLQFVRRVSVLTEKNIRLRNLHPPMVSPQNRHRVVIIINADGSRDLVPLIIFWEASYQRRFDIQQGKRSISQPI